MSAAGWPARYEVRVEGVLDGRWSEWFGGLQVSNQGDQTILSGTLRDQPALHGVLDQVGDLGLTVITVRRLPPERPETGPALGIHRTPSDTSEQHHGHQRDQQDP